PVAPSDSTTTPTSATLPSIDPASQPGSGPSPPAPAPWTLSLAGSSAHTVSVAADASTIIVTVDGSATSRPLAGISALSITGGSGNDSFSIGTSSLPVHFDGGPGTDTLLGPAPDSTWTIDGPGGGSVGNVTFANFENLTGAPDNHDTFELGPGGSISRAIDGGHGGGGGLILYRRPPRVQTSTSPS